MLREMKSGGRNNFGRRGGGASGGRSGGGYQGGQGGGRGRSGSMRLQGNQYHYQGRGQQQRGNRPPVQAYQGGVGSGGSPRPRGSRPGQGDPSQGSGAGVQRQRRSWGAPAASSSPDPAQPTGSITSILIACRDFCNTWDSVLQDARSLFQSCRRFSKLILLLIEGASSRSWNSYGSSSSAAVSFSQ